jgi:hypothetical protein
MFLEEEEGTKGACSNFGTLSSAHTQVFQGRQQGRQPRRIRGISSGEVSGQRVNRNDGPRSRRRG